MTRHLPWKAKVVRNTLLSLTICMAVITATRAQSPASSVITCSFESTKFEHVIDFLSANTGVYFVYSSNKIKIEKAVTLSVIKKPLADVLDLLGDQLGLVFRLDGRHVMIKSVDKPTPTLKAAQRYKSNFDNNPSLSRPIIPSTLTPTVRQYFPPALPETKQLFGHDDQLKKQFTRLQPYFDSTFLKRVPAHYIRKIGLNDLHQGLFISVGPTLNDYASGLEVQAGIRQAYLIFSPGWLRNGDYHGGYGIGSSIKLNNNFAFNPAYMYASVSGSESYYRLSNYARPSQFVVEHKTNHHQVRLMLQYAAVPNLMVRLGPSLNHSTTTYRYHETDLMTVEIVREQYVPDTGNGYFNTVTKGYTNVSNATPVYNDTKARDFWIGWEASIAFKINFFQNK